MMSERRLQKKKKPTSTADTDVRFTQHPQVASSSLKGICFLLVGGAILHANHLLQTQKNNSRNPNCFDSSNHVNYPYFDVPGKKKTLPVKWDFILFCCFTFYTSGDKSESLSSSKCKVFTLMFYNKQRRRPTSVPISHWIKQIKLQE